MAIFAILLPEPQPRLAEAIVSKFANEFLHITETQYLVSTRLTAVEIVEILGIYDPKNPGTTTGSAIVLGVGSYFGRASPVIWEWMKAKFETPPRA